MHVLTIWTPQELFHNYPHPVQISTLDKYILKRPGPAALYLQHREIGAGLCKDMGGFYMCDPSLLLCLKRYQFTEIIRLLIITGFRSHHYGHGRRLNIRGEYNGLSRLYGNAFFSIGISIRHRLQPAAL